MRSILLAAAVGLAGCDPPPRSPSYFAQNPREADLVLTQCAAGARRGEECLNALAAGKAARDAARRKLFKDAF